jgi:hypothetical protein
MTGALAAGAAFATLGMIAGYELCGYDSDRSFGKCSSYMLYLGLGSGAIGFTVGGMIGSAIPRSSSASHVRLQDGWLPLKTEEPSTLVGINVTF